MGFCETWVNDSEPRFCNYKSEWKHRNEHGGGLGFLIKRGIQYNTLNLVPFPNGILEFQTIMVFQTDKTSIHIMNLYNPNLNISFQEMEHYIAQLGDKYLIIGDFNGHSPILASNCRRSNPTGRMLEEIILKTNTVIANPIDFYTHLNVSTDR